MDAYGHQINLTYKNDSSFKTTFGGLVTILTRLGIFAYFILEMNTVFQRKSTIKETLKILNILSEDI